MLKFSLKKIKENLEAEKIAIEEQLKKIAKKDEKLPDDWDTVFPKYNSEESGSSAMEIAADEVEEYETLLPIEHTLETELKDINLALEKIKKNKYGKCEKCGKAISVERLKASPEARFCLKCKR